EDVAARIYGDVLGMIELPVPATSAAPRREEGPVAVELLDAVVAAIGNEDGAASVYRDPVGELELPVATPLAAPRRQECPGARALLYALIWPIHGEVVPVPIHRDAIGAGLELPIPTARNPGQTRRGAGLEGRHAVRYAPAEGQEKRPAAVERLDAVVQDVG